MRSVRARDLKSVVFTGTVLLILLLAQAVSAAGRLFIGTDENAFANGELAVVNTDCATADIFSGRIITLNFPLNGVAAGPGFLWAGQPLTVGASPGNTLRVVSENEASTASPVFTIPAGNPAFSADCCNEQMVSAPDGAFYHAHRGGNGHRWHADLDQQVGRSAGWDLGSRDKYLYSRLQHSGTCGRLGLGRRLRCSVGGIGGGRRDSVRCVGKPGRSCYSAVRIHRGYDRRDGFCSQLIPRQHENRLLLRR